jgi:hypothetical protein
LVPYLHIHFNIVEKEQYMNINKVMVYVFFIVISSTLSAMELEKKLEDVKKSRPRDIINRPSENSSPAYSLSFSLPTITNVINGANSLVTTVNNYWYPSEALKKLGWPEGDTLAQQELKISQDLYKKVTESLEKRETYNGFSEDCDRINRRQGYCQRALQELPNCPQGVQLALFCLKYHRAAMNSFDLTRFLIFVEEEQEKAKQIGAEFSLLTILPDEENQSLDKLFKQTLVVKNHSKEAGQQKEEEKKRLEEDAEKKSSKK